MNKYIKQPTTKIIFGLFSIILVMSSQAVLAAPDFSKATVKPLVDKNKLIKKKINPAIKINTTCPDLKLERLHVNLIQMNGPKYAVYIRGNIRNIGSIDFVSVRGRQRVHFSSPGAVDYDSPFVNVPKRMTANVLGVVRGMTAGEFTQNIIAKIQYDPTLRADRNKANDDCNMRNNRVIITADEINRAITDYHSTHRRPVVRKPDLSIRQVNPANGTVEIVNLGNADAPINKLIMTCHKVNTKKKAPGYGCPKAIRQLPKSYRNQTFVGYIFNVPAIRPGGRYFLRMPGTTNGKWKKGQYKFTYRVDVKKTVNESNERNNLLRKTLAVAKTIKNK